MQAFPRHSLSRAALITSGAPIFLLDSFTSLIVSPATPSLCIPPSAVAGTMCCQGLQLHFAKQHLEGCPNTQAQSNAATNQQACQFPCLLPVQLM